jgi:hypothetical protein
MDKEFRRALKTGLEDYKKKFEDKITELEDPGKDGTTNHKVLSLKEHTIRYCLKQKLSLESIPSDLRITINIRRYISSLCEMLDPFVHQSPYLDLCSPLEVTGDLRLERKSEVRLHLAGLEMFGVKDEFYNDEMLNELRKERARRSLQSYIYFKYHLDEHAFRQISNTRDAGFEIGDVDIGYLLELDPLLAKFVSRFE